MNEIEKTIDYLSLAITNEENILEKEPEGTALEGFLVRNISALAIAVQALQEKAERDKMRCANCEYGCPADYGICNCASHKMNDTDYDTYCSYFEPRESEDKND